MILGEMQLQSSSVSNRVICIRHGHSFMPGEVIVGGFIHPVCLSCLEPILQGRQEEPLVSGQICEMDTCMETAEAVPCKLCGQRKCIIHMWASGKDAICKACMEWSGMRPESALDAEGDSKADDKNALAFKGQCSAGDCSGNKNLYYCKLCDSTYCAAHMWGPPDDGLCLFCRKLTT